VHLDLVAFFHYPDDLAEVGEVDIWRDALGVEVQGEGHEVDVAGPLSVAEEASLDPISDRHLGQLGGGHGAASVVVGVEGDADLLALGDALAEELNLVRVYVRGRHLDGGGEVEDDGVLDRGLPGLLYRLADPHGKLGAGVGEGLRAEFESPFRPGLGRIVLGQGPHQGRTPARELDTLVL